MPARKDIGIDTHLTNVSLLYKNEADAFAMRGLFPQLSVAKDTGKIRRYGREHFIVKNAYKADKGPSRKAEYSVSDLSYSLELHALHDVVSGGDVQNSDAPLAPFEDATEMLTQRLALHEEREIAKIVFTTTAASNSHSLAATAQWSLYSTTSDPIADVQTASLVILKNSGTDANVVGMNYEVAKVVRLHPTVTARVQYVQAAFAEINSFAMLFDVERFVISKAVYNTAKRGATESMAYAVPDNVIVAHVAPSPSVRSASFGYLLTKGSNEFAVRRWEENALGSVARGPAEKIEVEYMRAAKIVGSLCGYLIEDALA